MYYWVARTDFPFRQTAIRRDVSGNESNRKFREQSPAQGWAKTNWTICWLLWTEINVEHSFQKAFSNFANARFAEADCSSLIALDNRMSGDVDFQDDSHRTQLNHLSLIQYQISFLPASLAIISHNDEDYSFLFISTAHSSRLNCQNLVQDRQRASSRNGSSIKRQSRTCCVRSVMTYSRIQSNVPTDTTFARTALETGRKSNRTVHSSKLWSRPLRT